MIPPSAASLDRNVALVASRERTAGHARRAISGLSALAAALSLSACGHHAKAPPPPVTVDVITVQPQTVAADTELSGRTVAYRIAEVRPQVSGLLQHRLFVEGSDVRQGQQLYQIDPSTYQAAYDKAVANLEAAKAKAQRYEQLVGASVVSKQDRDDAVSAWHQAQADVEATHIDLVRTRMEAPISGRIGRSLATEGALVTADQAATLSTVTQLDPIFVDVQQASDALLALRRNVTDKNLSADSKTTIPVRLILEDGKPYAETGRLAFSEVNVDQGTGMTTLRAVFPNPKHLLLPGMYVRAHINAGDQHDAYLVPQDDVQRDIHADPYVLTVAQDGTVKQVAVKIGGQNGASWIITSGLNPGDRVLASGFQQVEPGKPVKIGHVAQGPAAVEIR